MGTAASAPIQATHSAPSNIALVKYWGKRDVAANLPINGSLSMTLSQADLAAVTTVTASPAFTSDRLWLNGAEEDITANARVAAVLREVRRRCAGRAGGADGAGAVDAAALKEWRVHIVSRNTFPTAAGLASSAAGYAALVVALADVLGAAEAFPGELTAIARRGSGSACRSLAGGFVEWRVGSRVDGTDSIGAQVAPRAHWPGIVVLIAVASAARKATGSTDGMVRSVATSALLRVRARDIVPARLDAVKRAIAARDFGALAEAAMADSNQFHATCLDTFPPVFYLNDTSRRVIALVHALNAAAKRTLAGYTFDAGPNAVLFTDGAADAAALLAALRSAFPPAPGAAAPYESGVALARVGAAAPAPHAPLPAVLLEPAPGALAHIYATEIGDGPEALGAARALADPVTGLPLDLTAAAGFDKGL